ncbi:MAG TPA: DUF3857 and transglutaminase domain-containing protein [Candidatus Acidoferrales bacterium]|nr:DUF3857 and transglutaminase domain-containing protein [Candidatus Acidoferrales bacterium]
MTWFSKHLLKHRIKAFLLTFAVAFGALTAAARGHSAPPWLTAAAQQHIPDYPADTVAVTLFEQQQITIDANGHVQTLYRVAYKILRPQAHDTYGTLVVPFDSETKIKSINAWSIPPSGDVYEVGAKEAMETGISPDALYSDNRQKILSIPAADPGNVIGYEYVQQERPFIREEEWRFQETIPVLKASFSLQLAPGWKMDSYWVNYPESKPQISDRGNYEWNLTDIPALPHGQDFMPAFAAVGGRLAIEYYQPAGSDDPVTWQSLGSWYASLTKDSRQATPEIQQEVAQLTANAHTTLDKIKDIADFVHSQIRYVAIEIGIGGFQPHSADVVFKNRYGDCKDMSTLLSAMLEQIGVKSYYVLIDADRGVVLPNVPTLHVDHAILAIQLPADVPATTLYATVDDPKLGKLLFFDSTDPHCPLGYIPAFLQDNYGLVVTPSGGELVKLPLLPPPTNRLMRTAQFTLSASGDLSAQTEEVRWGAPAEDLRSSFVGAAPKDRVKIIENFLSTFLTNFQLTRAQIGNLDASDKNLLETYDFVAPSYAKQSGDLLLLRPCVLGEKELTFDSEKPRQYPVEFPTSTLDTDQFNITLPPGYIPEQLPAPVQISDPFLSYKSETKLVGNVLQYTRSYEVKASFVAVKDLSQLKRDFAAISDDERSLAVLHHVAP